MAEPKFSVGNFVRYKPSAKDITYLVLDAGSEKANCYKLQSPLCLCINVPFDKSIDSASEAHKTEWIKGRTEKLCDSDKIGPLIINYLKSSAKQSSNQEIIYNGLTQTLVLSEENQQAVKDALKQALKDENKFQQDEQAGTISLIKQAPPAVEEPAQIEQEPKEAAAPKTTKTSSAKKTAYKKPIDSQPDTNRSTVEEAGVKSPGEAEKSSEQPAEELTEVGEKLPQEASGAQDAKQLQQEQETKLDEDMQDQTEVCPALTTDSMEAKAALDENEPIFAEQITEKSLKQAADELTQAWENLPPEASEAERNKLAEQMRVILDPPPEPSEAAKTVTDFFDFCEADPETHHPLFWILSGQASPMQRRQLIGHLGLGSLEKYVQWLEKRSSTTNDLVPVSQIEGLLDGLANSFSQAFQGATREGGVNHYKRIAQSMLTLLKLDAEVGGPYEWRLFSFLRESWARTAPHAQAGDNDLIGARDYLNWLLDEEKHWPETIWLALLTSLMRDEALERLHGDTQQRVLQYAAEYAFSAPKGQKKTRLLSFQEALSEETMIKFLQTVDKVSKDTEKL